jgi:uncharacterized membrane protein
MQSNIKSHQTNLKLHSGSFSIEKHDLENLSLNERLASMFLGGILLTKSIKNPFKSRFIQGAYLTYRGITGKCIFYDQLGINSKKPHAINIRGEFIIDMPTSEVYTYWRNLNNLPGSLKHLMDVKIIDERLSSWKSDVLGHLFSVKWNAEIVKDEPGHLIGWSSVKDSIIKHVGKVEFTKTADGKGTVLTVVLSYHPPIGGLGIGLAHLLNPFFEQALNKEIQTFKHTIESKPLLHTRAY